MPYKTLRTLPPGVRHYLTKRAQQIYLETFNNAWKTYRDSESRRNGATREEVSHRVAWTAVKRQYKKDPQTGKWKRKVRGLN